jgi:V/A-type H+-transporting ATPase subunit D
MLTEALMLPGKEGSLVASTRNVMSVNVPIFHYTAPEAGENGGAGYGLAFTSGELDDAIAELCEVTDELMHLAELEKSALLLCDEIERTRRRVNALEYIMIPQYEVAIKSITMKLDENERGNTSRLMKVKDMMIAQQLENKHADDEEEDLACGE